jgi:beta-lactamase superfamily II metal-dependent hydrolase
MKSLVEFSLGFHNPDFSRVSYRLNKPLEELTMHKRLIVFILCLLIISPHLTAEAKDKTMDVHFIDVGQADSILIQTPRGKNLLIDAGDEQSSKELVEYLKVRNIKTLDALIATHPHHDHIGGMSRIMNEFTVKAFYMPDLNHYTNAFRDLHKAVSKKGIMIFKAKAGDKIEVESGIKIKIIAPLRGHYDSLNDYSYVMKLIYKQTSFLLMADAGEQSETALLDRGVNVKADIIKIGHHGANTGTTLPFLKEVDPEAAVISVGNRNPYGYPSKVVINRLRYLKIPTYRTDLLGTIVAHSDGHYVSFTYGNEELKNVMHKVSKKGTIDGTSKGQTKF